MLSTLPCHPSDRVFTNLLRQRSRPHVLIVDGDATIVFAEPHALSLFGDHFAGVQQQVRDLIQALKSSDALHEQLFDPGAGIILRIVPMNGPDARLFALFFENEARREDLKEAVSRFSFTPREVEVLDRILGGMSAAEIADDLCIAEVTVFDHFKHISHKTKAKNRADMLAKVFNWQPALKSTLAERRSNHRAVHESRIH